MKNKFKNIILITAILLSNIIFANDPDGAGGGVDPTDAQAPIDSNIMYLAIIGIAYFCYQYSKKIKNSSSSF